MVSTQLTEKFKTDRGPGQRSPRIQPKLRVNAPGDRYEQEANAMAGQVMRRSASENAFSPSQGVRTSSLQRKCAHCEQEETKKKPGSLMRKAEGSGGFAAPSGLVSQLGRGGGAPMPGSTRNFMENAFSADFSRVRVHTDGQAAQMSRQIGAKAFTHGQAIYFNQGQYAPETGEGKRLLAHELTHTIQQRPDSQPSAIQRDCNDPNFCTPYATPAEAASEEAFLRRWYLPADETSFGASSRSLYERYLSRRPGDSLTPVLFNNPANDVVASFADSSATSDDQERVIDLVGARLNRAPGPLRDYTVTMMSLSNFLTTSEMDNRPINYSNPFSIAGHIAGGAGSSDAGNDYRKIVYGNVTLEKIPVAGLFDYVHVETTLQYEVFDAIDFCPGDCGSGLEQRVTIPMSRLEASGEAYDVPFRVNFTPESMSKRFLD